MISKIQNYKFLPNKVNFTSNNKSNNVQVPVSASNLKVIPLVVLFAMSPLNAVDVKSQNVDSVVDTEYVDINSVMYKNATPDGEICNISRKGDNVVLDFPLVKKIPFYHNGEDVDALKIINSVIDLDTLRKVKVTENNKVYYQYFVEGNGKKVYYPILDAKNGEALLKTPKRECEMESIKQSISEEFYEYLTKTYPEVSNISENVLRISGRNW